MTRDPLLIDVPERLLTRRLLERGVRFVQLYHWGWDSHGTGPGDDLLHSLPERVQQVALVSR